MPKQCIRRTKIRIYLEILSLLRRSEASKNEIVLKVNLNHNNAAIYLDTLEHNGHVEKGHYRNTWRITEKGKNLLMTPEYHGLKYLLG